MSKVSVMPTKNDEDEAPRTIAIAKTGIHTADDAARLMGAVAEDVILNRIVPSVANAAVNATGKMLKVVEMQIKYGTKAESGKQKTLLLTAMRPEAR